MKNWFMLYCTQWEVIKKLSTDDQASLLRAVYSYHNWETVEELSALADLAFTMLKTQFEIDEKKYEKVVEARKEAGKQWGLAKVANAKSAKQNVAKLSKSTDKDKDNVKDNDKENDKVSLEKKQIYSGFDLSFLPEHLIEPFKNFIDMRKTDSKDRITQYWLRLLYNDLERLSAVSSTQIAIVNQSIKKWRKGMFELKDSEKTKDIINQEIGERIKRQKVDEDLISKQIDDGFDKYIAEQAVATG